MSIEAMKQALEALESTYKVFHEDEEIADAITSLRQAIATEESSATQEPIARVTGVYGGRFIVKPLNPAMVLPTNMALYAEPQPKQEPAIDNQDLTIAYMSGFHDGKKAERRQRSDRWVGLTDEEFDYCVNLKVPEAIAEETEAKLKEKNT